MWSTPYAFAQGSHTLVTTTWERAMHTMNLVGPVRRIFLDVDGVLADFTGGVAKWFGLEVAACEAHSDRLHDVATNGDKELMWSILSENQTSPRFFAELPVLPWAHELVALCGEYADTCVLTSPPREPMGTAGKYVWLTREFPKLPFMISRHKAFAANPTAVLIDDRQKQVDRFIGGGGQAVLFPASHNAHKDWQIEDFLAQLREELAGSAGSRMRRDHLHG